MQSAQGASHTILGSGKASFRVYTAARNTSLLTHYDATIKHIFHNAAVFRNLIRSSQSVELMLQPASL